jgi:hypothetical protein
MNFFIESLWFKESVFLISGHNITIFLIQELYNMIVLDFVE